MKTFTWLFTFGFALVCLACWALSYFLVAFTFPELGTVLPAVTRFTLFPNTWIPFCPLPWIVYAVALSRRAELTHSAALVFAITIIAATALLVIVIVTACFLPLRAMT